MGYINVIDDSLLMSRNFTLNLIQVMNSHDFSQTKILVVGDVMLD